MSGDILIVDDDDRLTRAIVRLLDRAGYATRTAPDGRRGLAAALERPPDLMLLDLLLPGKSGTDVLAELHQLGKAPPVIAMSGICPKPQGCDAFLSKPFKGPELLAKVEALIGSAQDRGAPAGQEVSSRPVAEVLWSAFEQELTGRLYFRSGSSERQLLLDRGHVTAVRSNDPRDRLGSRLAALGRLDREVSARAHVEVQRSSRPYGEVYVSLGVLTPKQLENELSAQARDKLLGLFAFEAPESWFEVGDCHLPEATKVRDLEPEELIIRGTRKMPLRRVKALLEPHADATIEVDAAHFEVSTVSGSMLKLLARLRPGLRVREVADEDLAMLYGAWLVQRVELRDGKQSQPAIGVRERQLASLVDRKEGADLYSVLGISPAASVEQIQTAYEKIAAEYRLERFAHEPRRMRDLAARMLVRVETAHSVLGDDLRREAYLKVLELRARSLASDDVTLTRVACEQADRHRAQHYVENGEYAKALPLLERLIEVAPDDLELAAWHGWSVCVVNWDDADGIRRSVECLKKVMERDPQSALAPYYLGRIFKHTGQVETARKLFRRALSREPDHLQAQRELRLLANRAK